MGSRAFSHESIFIPDGREESEASVQAMSQENIVGKVKTLQVRKSEATRGAAAGPMFRAELTQFFSLLCCQNLAIIAYMAMQFFIRAY